MIDEFLSTPSRDPLSHLVLICSTRSKNKSDATIQALRTHTTNYLAKNKELKQRAAAKGMSYAPKEEEKRIHFLGANVDLCDLRSIYRLASTLRGEGNGLSCPAREDGTGALGGINIPRLDVLYLNAGIGGWIGIPWVPAIWGCITGLPESITYWKWLIFPERGATVKPQVAYLESAGGEKVEEKTAGKGRQEERIDRKSVV